MSFELENIQPALPSQTVSKLFHKPHDAKQPANERSSENLKQDFSGDLLIWTFAREHGYVETILGRRRYLPDIHSHNQVVRGGAERNAVNAPIQGSAADIIKIAMIRIHNQLQAQKFQTRMLLQVHDELVFDVPKTELEIVKPLVKEAMENAFTLAVPLVADLGVGDNWLDAH